MGFISKIFGAIFGFISSLFGSIGKVFGLGGKSDYFIELDDSKAASAPPAPATPTAPAAPAPTPQATEAPKPSAASAQSEKKAEPASEAVKPAPAASSTNLNGAAANGSASLNNGEVIPGMTFAPDMMLPVSTSGGRRRPGPSLSPFKVMARDMQRS